LNSVKTPFWYPIVFPRHPKDLGHTGSIRDLSGQRVFIALGMKMTKKNPAAATTTVMMALKMNLVVSSWVDDDQWTHSHLQPAIPYVPFRVSWIATCMNETNIEAAGYELLNIATLVANSDGVLLDQLIRWQR
jgi:hypothetical protein